MSREDRRFHVVLWGATGFTGRLVAEALAELSDAGALAFALGGRDRAKLEAVRAGLAARSPHLAALPILVGDARDPASLRAIAADTRVVATTVGPYAKYGSELVAACVEAGTDYCDLAGETLWMRAMIDAHHRRARETGARIVHACGFDSIPSDLGTYFLQQRASALGGGPCREVKAIFRMSGGISGGTAAAMLNVMDEIRRDRRALRVLMDPYGLNPDPSERGPDGPDPKGIAHDAGSGLWTAPFFMAPVNTRIVRRSNALLGFSYGRDFRYTELLGAGRGARGLAAAGLLTAGLGAGLAALQVPALRSLIARRLPAPGEGPSPEVRAQGRFEVRLAGVRADGRRVQARVAGHGDPGYACTSRMLAASALCLALDELPAAGGVLTPAAAMGLRLVERLRAVGLSFEADADAPAEAERAAAQRASTQT